MLWKRIIATIGNLKCGNLKKDCAIFRKCSIMIETIKLWEKSKNILEDLFHLSFGLKERGIT